MCVSVSLDGPRGVGTVQSISDDEIELRCCFEATIPSRPRIDVLLALPRPKVLRRLWAQFAALGVGQIILTNAERVERHYFDTHVLTSDCYRPLLVEGLQQARDTRLPIVSIHRRFKVLVEDQARRPVRARSSPGGPPCGDRCMSRLWCGRASKNESCLPSGRRAAGTTSSSTFSRPTASRPWAWVHARCGPTPRALRSSHSCTTR